MTEQRPASAPNPLTLALVSTDGAVRERLGSALRDLPDLALVDVAPSDGHLGHLDVVLFDAVALDEGGVEDLNHLLATNPCVIALGRWQKPELSAIAVALGAAEVLPVDLTEAELAAALRALRAGDLRPAAAAVRRAADQRRADLREQV